jgi:hypothetical protein
MWTTRDRHGVLLAHREPLVAFDVSTGRLHVYIAHEEKDGAFTRHVYQFAPARVVAMTKAEYEARVRMVRGPARTTS